MDVLICDNPSEENQSCKMNGTIDILKLVMALLVVGIHTNPFGFNVWLDRGFGLVTRLCVPFFFCTSAYFYWSNEKGAMHFLKRILLLYIIWVLVYLPSEIICLSLSSVGQILYSYLWSGNQRALWYLSSSAIGFILTYLLLKILKPEWVFILSAAVLGFGCSISTWSPLFEQCFGIQVVNSFGGKNGLFYAFPYTALGMLLAKRKIPDKGIAMNKLLVGFFISFLALCVECSVFEIVFQTSTAILWFSVMPCTFFFFMFGKSIEIQIEMDRSLIIRKLSTLIYVSQYLFIPILSKYCETMILFLLTSVSSFVFSLLIIKLSGVKYLRWLKILY